MRTGKRMTGVLLFALLFGIAGAGTAAATETIDRISIKVNSNLTAGDNLDDIEIDGGQTDAVQVSVSSDKYEVTEAKWTTKASKGLAIGDEPRMVVTLTPTDVFSDYFKSSYTSKEIKVSGGEYISARKSGEDLLVTLKTKPVKGTFEEPEDAYWKETGIGNAVWEVKNKSAGAYEVWLYRGKKVVQKVSDIRATSYNLYPYMTEEGVYTFKVRTIPHSSEESKYGKKSEWVESGELVITERDVSDGSGQKGKKEAPQTTSSAKEKSGWYKKDGKWYYKNENGEEQRGGWLELGDKWYLFQVDGAMVSGWHAVDGRWYYLSDSGEMMTGWSKIAGKWYYFNPSSEQDPLGAAVQGWNIIDGYTFYFGEDCSMYKGWLLDRGTWYYMNELEGGLEGAMLKGWIHRNGKSYYTDEFGIMQMGWLEIDGYYHYFYPEDGSMAVDTLINGFYVNEDGIWTNDY